MKKTIILILIAIVIIISITTYYHTTKDKELIFIENPNITENFTIRMLNCSEVTKEMGLVITLNESLSPIEKKAFLYGLLAFNDFFNDFRMNISESLLTIGLNCANKTKVYYDYSDLPEGDDCIDENHCFIKWRDANVLTDETEDKI